MRSSGRGSPDASRLAIAQIFCFAPSSRPDMLPVVSSTNTTSIRGRAFAGFTATAVVTGAAAVTGASTAPGRRVG